MHAVLKVKYTSDIFTRFKVYYGQAKGINFRPNGSVILVTKFNWCKIDAQFDLFGAEIDYDLQTLTDILGVRGWGDFILALQVDELMDPMRFIPFNDMSPYINGWMSPDEDMQVTTDVLFDEFVKDTYVRNVRI